MIEPRRVLPTVLVAGIGNELCGDDGVGPAVVRRLAQEPAMSASSAVTRVVEDPFDLFELWAGTALAVVVDATTSGAAPGSVRVVDLDVEQVEGDARRGAAGRATPTSSHGFGLASALAMARALGRAPGRVMLVGIEGAGFEIGTPLSPAVAAAVPDAAALVRRLVEELRLCA